MVLNSHRRGVLRWCTHAWYRRQFAQRIGALSGFSRNTLAHRRRSTHWRHGGRRATLAVHAECGPLVAQDCSVVVSQQHHCVRGQSHAVLSSCCDGSELNSSFSRSRWVKFNCWGGAHRHGSYMILLSEGISTGCATTCCVRARVAAHLEDTLRRMCCKSGRIPLTLRASRFDVYLNAHAVGVVCGCCDA